tara:strand:+ start:30 stop:1316 length:1287 start_codon:yes stop_codon:yes gene_type:complete
MKQQSIDQNEYKANRERVLRDLNWAITSVSLISESPETAEQPETLDLTLINKSHLTEFLAPYNHFRIGQYYEGLVLYWLEHIRRLKIIARHQQVFEDSRTVGEIDVLFEDEAGVLTHWEIAVKFYLYYPEVNPVDSHFIGPNVKDSFERKMRRLFEYQLPLSQTHFPDVRCRRAFVKGMIFYHPDQSSSAQLPEKLSSTHPRGTWLHLSELSRLTKQHGELLFLIREKPDWLSAALCSETDTRLFSFAELQQQLETHFQDEHRPILVSALNCAQSICREVDRVFIVSDSWPQILNCKSLSKLGIANTQLSPAGLENLKSVPRLYSLTIDGRFLTEECLEVFNTLPELKSLIFTECQLDQKHLERLKQLRHIAEFRFDSVSLPESAVEDLGNLAQATSLGFYETNLSRQDVVRLQKTLPQCNVYRFPND